MTAVLITFFTLVPIIVLFGGAAWLHSMMIDDPVRQTWQPRFHSWTTLRPVTGIVLGAVYCFTTVVITVALQRVIEGPRG